MNQEAEGLTPDQHLTCLVDILFFLFVLYVILDGSGSLIEEPPPSSTAAPASD